MTEQVWVVDDDSAIRWVLERALAQAGFNCQSFADAESLLAALPQGQPNAVVSDIRMGKMDGLTLLAAIHQQRPALPVIIMTAHSDLDSAVNAYRHGAFEYLPKPFDIDDAVTLVQRAVAHFSLTHTAKAKHSQANTRSSSATEISTPEIIGEAPAMQEVFRAIGRLARSSISVLINGQSGTGKELVANALHKHSPRANKPFIALNMAAIPKDLIESELFGHEKGAFTGANSIRQGRFEQANGGTLFLDEIGDMPLDVQTRLLRVLSDGQFYRVGGHHPLKTDVRIIAATHQNLELNVASGDFREDLFHRLNVIRILMPSLKDRYQDIPKLTQHFLAQAATELSVGVKSLHSDAERYLQSLPWPGNVRQLENVCRWLTVMASGQEIVASDLPEELQPQTQLPLNTPSQVLSDSNWRSHLQQWAEQEFAQGREALLTDVLPEVEQILLECALKHSQGHKQEAAKLLGWGRNTLTRKLKT